MIITTEFVNNLNITVFQFQMYWNTKEYMSDHLVKPVLRRADSVKHLGNAVLDSRVSNFAADRLVFRKEVFKSH